MKVIVQEDKRVRCPITKQPYSGGETFELDELSTFGFRLLRDKDVLPASGDQVKPKDEKPYDKK